MALGWPNWPEHVWWGDGRAELPLPVICAVRGCGGFWGAEGLIFDTQPHSPSLSLSLCPLRCHSVPQLSVIISRAFSLPRTHQHTNLPPHTPPPSQSLTTACAHPLQPSLHAHMHGITRAGPHATAPRTYTALRFRSFAHSHTPSPRPPLRLRPHPPTASRVRVAMDSPGDRQRTGTIGP